MEKNTNLHYVLSAHVAERQADGTYYCRALQTVMKGEYWEIMLCGWLTVICYTVRCINVFWECRSPMDVYVSGMRIWKRYTILCQWGLMFIFINKRGV